MHDFIICMAIVSDSRPLSLLNFFARPPRFSRLFALLYCQKRRKVPGGFAAELRAASTLTTPRQYGAVQFSFRLQRRPLCAAPPAVRRHSFRRAPSGPRSRLGRAGAGNQDRRARVTQPLCSVRGAAGPRRAPESALINHETRPSSPRAPAG